MGSTSSGYFDGKNLGLEIAAKETYEEYRRLIRSYKENKPDAIVTIGGTARPIMPSCARLAANVVANR